MGNLGSVPIKRIDFAGVVFRSAMLDVEFVQLSDDGRLRDHNEDYLGYFQPSSPAQSRSHGWLFALADGVGGHDQGEVASKTAVDEMIAQFRSAPSGEPLGMLLPRLIQHANQLVYATGRSASPGGTAMASTIVACALRHDRVVVAHVGDSRCYLVRQGQARQITRDHTVSQEQMRMGLMTAKDADSAATRHVLSRALGTEMFVNSDVSELQALAGDILVQCCDGLHNSVTGAEIAAIVSQARELESAGRELIALANERDGSDNISVQIIRARSVERVGMYRGRPYQLR